MAIIGDGIIDGGGNIPPMGMRPPAMDPIPFMADGIIMPGTPTIDVGGDAPGSGGWVARQRSNAAMFSGVKGRSPPGCTSEVDGGGDGCMMLRPPTSEDEAARNRAASPTTGTADPSSCAAGAAAAAGGATRAA